MIKTICRCFLALVVATACFGAVTPPQDCPARPYPNTPVKNPLDLLASGGVLNVALTLRSREMMELPLKVCYAYQGDSGVTEAPTLRLSPGDLLELALTDRMSYVRPHKPIPQASPQPHDPCTGGTVATTSTNIDFAGLNFPTNCHQGEVSVTTIENADPPFEYKVRIPKDNPPGLYLYRADRVGSATLQVNGGASGALIVSGMEKAKPEVAGLPERILILRQEFDEPDSWPPGEYRMSLNFQPASYPQLPSPVIQMKPGAKEFWRAANATTEAFLALRLMFGTVAQPVRLVALDGVPVRKSVDLKTIELPPGGRAEFVVTAPALGVSARWMQTEFETGRTGLENPAQELARLVAVDDAEEPPALAPSALPPASSRLAPSATAIRKLYFAEAPNGTNGPTRYFLTVEGQRPKLFDPSGPPAVVTKVGAVEDWIVANHSGEVHAFHMHGIHFLLLAANGKTLPNPELRDTVTVPAWEGEGPFPTVKLRMDFRDPSTVGTFVFQCDVMHHAEAGMTAKIRIDR